jgi:hypothetical protein
MGGRYLEMVRMRWTTWAPCGPQLITPEELWEAITCKPEVGLEHGNSR